MEENANLKFVDYKVTKSTINVSGDFAKKVDINFNTLQERISPELFKNVIEITITDVNGGIFINVIIEGNFEIIGTVSKENIDSFIKINSTSIMFPFLRSYIASLTSLSGVPPLVLPLFNLAEMK